MRRGRTVGTVLAMAVVLLAAALPATGASGNPFVGSWQNVDAFDGSHQHMLISGGPGHFHYRDDAASACRNAGFGFVPATLNGVGEFDLDSDPPTFAFTADVYCHVRGPGGRQLLGEVSLTFFYDASTDTLSESAVQCWWRSGKPETCY